MFFRTPRCLIFSSVFSSFRRHCSCLSNVFFFFAILQCFLSWFSFTNLLFVLLQKSFCFRNQKVVDSCLIVVLFEKPFFPDFSTFRYKTVSHAWSSKIVLPFVCVFEHFLKTIFFIPLFLFKKTLLKRNWFSLLFLFTSSSSCSVLSSCVFSLCLLNDFSNVHNFFFYYPVVTRWKKSCFFNKLVRTSHHFPSQKFPGRIFFFSSFSILFHSIQAFFANKETFCFFYLVCIFRKKLLLFFKKKKESLSWKKFSFLLSSSVSCILVSSLFVFVHHSPLFFVSVFAWSFVFLVSFFLNSVFLYFTFNFLWTTISPSSCINKKKNFSNIPFLLAWVAS